MKKIYIPFLLMLVLLSGSCSVIGGIFKAGAAVGVIAVVVIIAVIIWVLSMFRGKS